MAESFPTSPAVGDYATAAWAVVVASDAVIVDAGLKVVTPSAANTDTTASVTFNKVFPSTPVVLLTNELLHPTYGVSSVWGKSTTGFSMVVNKSDTNPFTVAWLAVLPQ